MLSDESLTRNEAVFRRYNKHRLDLLRDSLLWEKRDVFDLIPLLLHENHPKLLGNMQKIKPLSGISGYAIAAEIKSLVSKYFRGVLLFDRKSDDHVIEFLAIIGSAGTAAFTEESDLDFWVGVDVGKYGTIEMNFFREKLRIIENWAATLAGLEVHFFIVDPKNIRANDYGAMTKESCGTALGNLLKDEFYRTGILVAGKLPCFWIVPAGTTAAEYRECISAAGRKCEAEAPSHIDLGYIPAVSRSEYFGAALWQILKGLHSPFKSTLKMALLDLYSSHETQPLLCDRFKRQVFSEAASEPPDPYLFLIESLRAFYCGEELAPVRKFVEKCFLLRTLAPLDSKSNFGRRREEQLFSIANKWNWSREELGRLSTFGSWNHEIQEAFRKDVIDFLVDSYQRIRDRTKDIPVRISASDLATVGRKIQRFFKQIPGKIPYEILLFEGKCASGIAIEETQGAERGWSASVSLGSEKKPLLRIVRAMPHPLFACGWCSVNGFYDGTQKIVFRGSGRVSERNLREAMAAIREFFPSGEADDSRLDVLVKDPVVSHLLLMPNWENPDGASALTSISVFYRTSMGEVFFGSNVGESCQSWLIKEILLGVVGKPNWPRLAWKVHVSVGTMKSTRRVSDALGRMVGHCLSGESEKPPTIFFRGNF